MPEHDIAVAERAMEATKRWAIGQILRYGKVATSDPKWRKKLEARLALEYEEAMGA